MIRISQASKYCMASALTGGVIVVLILPSCPLIFLDQSFAHGAYVAAAGMAIYLSIRSLKTAATATPKELPFLIFWLICLTPILLIGLCVSSSNPSELLILDKKKDVFLIRVEGRSDYLTCVKTIIPNLIGQRLLTLQFWETPVGQGGSEIRLIDERFAYVRLQAREFKVPVYPARLVTDEMLLTVKAK